MNIYIVFLSPIKHTPKLIDQMGGKGLLWAQALLADYVFSACNQLRLVLVILVLLANHCVWVLEQPRQTLLAGHRRFSWLINHVCYVLSWHLEDMVFVVLVLCKRLNPPLTSLFGVMVLRCTLHPSG